MPGKLEAELQNGLIMGHAYSITDVKLVNILLFLSLTWKLKLKIYNKMEFYARLFDNKIQLNYNVQMTHIQKELKHLEV